MIVEDLDHRVWAALRPVDAVTGRTLEAKVRGEGQHWLRNPSGLWVLNRLAAPTPRAAEWQAYEDAFLAPPSPAPWLLQVTLHTPGGQHLARRFSLTLPRSAAGPQAPLFAPQDVPLYPAPACSLALGWALLRLSLTRNGRPAGGAVFSVHEGDRNSPVLGRGQTDARGEGVLAVSGQPYFMPSAGPEPFTRERTLNLHGVFEAAAAAALPDPDNLATRSGVGYLPFSTVVTLASGRSTVLALDLP